jgi:hypothetical protein
MGGPLGAIIGRYPSAAAGGDDELGGGGAPGAGIIRHNRRCRDIAFLVIFAAFWVAMIVNSSFGFNQGNPLRSDSPPPPSSSLSGSLLALLPSSFRLPLLGSGARCGEMPGFFKCDRTNFGGIKRKFRSRQENIFSENDCKEKKLVFCYSKGAQQASFC